MCGEAVVTVSWGRARGVEAPLLVPVSSATIVGNGASPIACSNVGGGERGRSDAESDERLIAGGG